jgi:aspartate/methionine/tyrosine aminotransferase
MLHIRSFYCSILENVNEFESKFFTDYILLKNKGLRLSEYLISLVNKGVLYFGFKMPGVDTLAKLLKVARNIVIKAFSEMVSAGYLYTQNGVRAVIRHPAYSQNKESEHMQDATYLNSPCVKPCYLTNDLVATFQREVKRSYEEIPPGQHNQVYYPLLRTLCEQLNQFQKTSYFPSNIYYMHDYQSLIRCIGLAIHKRSGRVIIPKNVNNTVRNAFESAGVRLVEVDTDGHGFSVNGLRKACISNKIIAIYMMPCINYADSADTSADRMKEIFKLREEYQLKLIIDDWYRPWLGTQKNFVLEMAKENLDFIIYVKPLTYLYEEMCRLHMVAANNDLILKIRAAAKRFGKQAYYSIAVATDYVLNDSIFPKTVIQVQRAMEELKILVNEVFAATGFWKAYGLRLESGPLLYIVPKEGRFHPHTYIRAKDAGFVVLNPISYNVNQLMLRGIRADLGSQVGTKHIKTVIIKIEKLFRSLCI